MNSKLNIIFSESGCPADGVLQKYLNGELSHSQKHDVEKHLIDCEMCSDELEGLQLMQDSEKLNLIVDRINDKIDYKTKVRILKPLFTFARIAAAVLIFVIIGSLYILYINFNSLKNDNVLSENINRVEAAAEQQKQESVALDNPKTDTSISNNNQSNTRSAIAGNIAEEKVKTKDILSKITIAEKKAEVKESEIDIVSDREISTASGANIGSTTTAYIDAIDDNLKEGEKAAKDIKAEPDAILKEETIADNTVTLSGKAEAPELESIVLSKTSKGNKSQRKEDTKAKSKSDESFAGLAVATTDTDKSKDDDFSGEFKNSAQASVSVTKSVAQESERGLIQNDDAGAETLLNLAIDDYTTEKFDDAKAKLEQIIINKNFVYLQKAQWYYALTLIKLNNKAKAKMILNDILKTSNHIYNNEAKEKLLELGE